MPKHVTHGGGRGGIGFKVFLQFLNKNWECKSKFKKSTKFQPLVCMSHCDTIYHEGNTGTINHN